MLIALLRVYKQDFHALRHITCHTRQVNHQPEL
jgi:hypothetical protein